MVEDGQLYRFVSCLRFWMVHGPGCDAMSSRLRRHVVPVAQPSASHTRGERCMHDLISHIIVLTVTIQFAAVPSYLSNHRVLGYHGSHARDTRGL